MSSITHIGFSRQLRLDIRCLPYHRILLQTLAPQAAPVTPGAATRRPRSPDRSHYPYTHFTAAAPTTYPLIDRKPAPSDPSPGSTLPSLTQTPPAIAHCPPTSGCRSKPKRPLSPNHAVPPTLSPNNAVPPTLSPNHAVPPTLSPNNAAPLTLSSNHAVPTLRPNRAVQVRLVAAKLWHTA